MKRPLAYITAYWGDCTEDNMKLAAKYCRSVYDAGYQPICPMMMHSLFLREAIPQEHMKSTKSLWPMKADFQMYGRQKKPTANL